MADILEGFGGVLAAHVEEDFFAAAADDRCGTISLLVFAAGKRKRSGGRKGPWGARVDVFPARALEVCDMKAQEKIGRALRMLIHKSRGIVDFFVDDEVEVLFTHTKKNPPNQPKSLRVCDLQQFNPP